VGLAERPQYEEMLAAVAAAVLAALPKTPVPDIALPDSAALAGVHAAIKAATAALPPPNQEVWCRTAEMLSEQRRVARSPRIRPR
jgi:hypothetical protein